MTSPVSDTTTTNTTTSTACSLTIPSGILADDLILLIFVRNNMTSLTDVACNSGSKPFTSLQGVAGPPGGASFRTSIWWRRADGAESGTVTSTVSANTSQRQVNIGVCIRGVDWAVNSGVPISCGTPVFGSSATSMDPPSCSMPGGVNRDFLALAHCCDIGPAFTGTPTGYTAIFSTGTVTATGLNHVLYYKQASGSSEDPSAFSTSSSTSYGTNTILIAGTAGVSLTSQFIIF